MTLTFILLTNTKDEILMNIMKFINVMKVNVNRSCLASKVKL